MARPTSTQDAVDLVRRARLVEESALAALPGGLSGDSPESVFESLVAAGHITPYQAEELANGRDRGFWLGPYKILDRLGKGGMGQVYLAEHTVLMKRVAVKVLSAALRADPQARRRFVREARAASVIDHPNVVHVHDVDVDHDPPYLVMEYIDGVSLQAAVSAGGSFSAGEAASVGVEIAHGLHAAAAAGLVHRDVKPANILIDRRGGVKILDLGIARLPGDDTQPPGDGAEIILGTIDYLAPEQAVNSAALDARADLYALGATLYFLLAGHPPFPSPNLRHKLAAKQYCDPPPVHRLRPDVDPALAAVVQKLLRRDPTDRYQSATDTAAALVPFSQLPPHFPARLFQPKRPSTNHDAPPAHESESPLPATQRIVRPNTLASPTDLPLPLSDTLRDGQPTDEIRAPRTDPARTPAPAGRPAELARAAPRRGTQRLWLATALGGLAILVALLLAFA